MVLAGSCTVTTPPTSDLQVAVTVWQHATGVVHLDMVNGAPGGDRIEFECYLAAGIDPCTRVVETGGFTSGAWTITAYAGDANAYWVFFENADVDVTVTWA
jgi:hypothetical protein